MPGAHVPADAGGNNADRAGAGDQYVFADQVKLQGAVGGVAKGVEESSEFRRDAVRYRPQVAGRHHHVFGEGAVALNADADGVGAQMLAPGAAVAAMPAHHVALG